MYLPQSPYTTVYLGTYYINFHLWDETRLMYLGHQQILVK